jgi:hypothetical protein
MSGVAAAAAPDLEGLDPVFAGVVVRRAADQVEFFQDRNKRWAFHCTDVGYHLLARLLHAASPVLGRGLHSSTSQLNLSGV